MKQVTSPYEAEVETTLTHEQILSLQETVRKVPVADHVYAYARDLVRATRPGEPEASPLVNELVNWGAGPRASIYLILAGKARAILHGRFHVTTDDIRRVAHPVLRHRVLTTFAAEAAGKTADQVIDELLATVPASQEKKLARA